MELWEGRVAYYRLKKEARLEIPGQKSTISFNAARLLIFRPWELTTWTSTQRPNLKVGNYKDDRWIIYNDGKKPA